MKWYYTVCVAVLSAAIAFFAAVLDTNRYLDKCGEFNDSSGQTINGKYVCWSNNVKSIGKMQGNVWRLGWGRSEPAWIYFCLLYVVFTVVHITTVAYRMIDRRRYEKEIGDYKKCDTLPMNFSAESSHIKATELRRICLVLLFLTVLVILFQCIEVGKTMLCRRPKGEFWYHVLAAISMLCQGAQLYYEVQYLRDIRRPFTDPLKATFYIMAAYNLIRWGDTIANSLCKEDNDNGEILGYEVWKALRPILRSSIVFFRILSASIYFTLPLLEDEKKVEIVDRSLQVPAIQKRMAGLADYMVNIATSSISGNRENTKLRKRVCEQHLNCFRVASRVYFSYSATTAGQRRLTDTLSSLAILGILVVILPSFAYAALHHTEGSDEAKYAVQATLSSISSLLCMWCLAIIPQWKSRDNRLTTNVDPFQERLSRRWVLEPEVITITLFGVSATILEILYCVFAHELQAKDEVKNVATATSAAAALDCSLQMLLLLMVMFRKKLKKTITRGKYIATTYALALLFCISLSSIILNMQREEMDEFVKEKSVLHGFMALAVDFRVHSAFINFSMLKEFVERRFPEGLEVYDIEAEHERGEPLFVSSYGAVDSSALTCKGPGCTNPVYPGPEPYMVCKMCRQACCKDCCEILFSKTGICSCAFQMPK